MKAISDAVVGTTAADTPDEIAQELHLNAFRTASLRQKLCEGRGWEGALVGLVRQVLEVGAVTGEPGWRRHRFLETSTTFEFASLAEWISDPNGLGTRPAHLIELLEISPEEEGRALADRVRQELRLGQGARTDLAPNLANNVREVSDEARQQEAGNSAAAVRRKIRSWIQQNPQAHNLALAKEWLARLECNPRSRLHQQALREIGIGKAKRVLDVSNVPEPLIRRLYDLAKDEQISVSEVLEDALAVYFRMDDEANSEESFAPDLVKPASEAQPPAAKSKPTSGNGNGHAKPKGILSVPAPGLYGATQLANALGSTANAISSAAVHKEDGKELLPRVTAHMPIRIVFRKSNAASQRYEVLPR